MTFARQLIETIYALANDPRPFGYKKLKGRNGYRVRSGDYRVIYEIIDNILLINVIAVGHRRDIYD
jgi:mRNA interferase RelE/StbE